MKNIVKVVAVFSESKHCILLEFSHVTFIVTFFYNLTRKSALNFDQKPIDDEPGLPAGSVCTQPNGRKHKILYFMEIAMSDFYQLLI